MFKKPYKPPQKVFAGIGNRDAPLSVQQLATTISKRLSKEDWWLNSGAAEGMDQAFMNGTMKAEVFVPWHNYNGWPLRWGIPKEAERLAKQFNPHWDPPEGKKRPPSRSVLALHARNMMIISGPHLDAPVNFVLCFTRDGCESAQTRSMETGGTGSAIAYADHLGIPVLNLANRNSLDLLSIFTEVDFTDLELPVLDTGF